MSHDNPFESVLSQAAEAVGAIACIADKYIKNAKPVRGGRFVEYTADAKDLMDALKTLYDSFMEARSKLDKELEEWKEAKSAREQEIEDLASDLKLKQDELKATALQREAEERQAEEVATQRRLQESEALEAHGRVISCRKSELESLANRIDDLRQTDQELAKDLSNKTNEIDALKAERSWTVDEREEEVRGLELTIGEKQDEVAQLNTRIEELQGLKTHSENLSAGAATALSEQRAELQRLRDSVRTQEETLQQLQQANREEAARYSKEKERLEQELQSEREAVDTEKRISESTKMERQKESTELDASLESKRVSVHNELGVLEAQVIDQIEKTKRAEEEFSAKETELADLQRSLDTKKSSFDQLAEHFESLNENVNSLKKLKSDFKIETDKYASERTQLQKETENSRKLCTTKRLELNSLYGRINAATSDHQSQQQLHAFEQSQWAEERRIDSAIQTQSRLLAELRQNFDMARASQLTTFQQATTIDSLTRQLKEQANELEEVTSIANMQFKDIIGLQDWLKGRMPGFERVSGGDELNQTLTLKTNIEKLLTTCSEKDRQLTDKASEASTNRATVDSLTEEKNRLRSRITDLENQNQSLTGQLATLRTIEPQLAEKKSELSNKDLAIETLTKEKDTLIEQTTALESRNNSLIEQNATLRAIEPQLAQKNSELSNKESAVESLTREKGTLAERIADLESQNQSLMTQLATCNDKIGHQALAINEGKKIAEKRDHLQEELDRHIHQLDASRRQSTRLDKELNDVSASRQALVLISAAHRQRQQIFKDTKAKLFATLNKRGQAIRAFNEQRDTALSSLEDERRAHSSAESTVQSLRETLEKDSAAFRAEKLTLEGMIRDRDCKIRVEAQDKDNAVKAQETLSRQLSLLKNDKSLVDWQLSDSVKKAGHLAVENARLEKDNSELAPKIKALEEQLAQAKNTAASYLKEKESLNADLASIQVAKEQLFEQVARHTQAIASREQAISKLNNDARKHDEQLQQKDRTLNEEREKSQQLRADKATWDQNLQGLEQKFRAVMEAQDAEKEELRKALENVKAQRDDFARGLTAERARHATLPDALDASVTTRKERSGGMSQPQGTRTARNSVAESLNGDENSDADSQLAGPSSRNTVDSSEVPNSRKRKSRASLSLGFSSEDQASMSTSETFSKRRRTARATPSTRGSRGVGTENMDESPQRVERASQSSSSSHYGPWEIAEVRQPDFHPSPIPAPIWERLRSQMTLWSNRRQGWENGATRGKGYCANRFSNRNRTTRSHEGFACDDCVAQRLVCTILDKGTVKLCPVKWEGEDNPGFGPEDTEFWVVEPGDADIDDTE